MPYLSLRGRCRFSSSAERGDLGRDDAFGDADDVFSEASPTRQMQ
jgi:hypothetical protein